MKPLAFITIVLLTVPLVAQQRRLPRAALVPATDVDLPGPVDSNSPAVWHDDDGGSRLQVFTSLGGQVQQASGPTVIDLGAPTPIAWVTAPLGGSWMEAVVSEQRVLYGYYHNEVPSPVCGDDGKVRPRIGAARSIDDGRTWEDLGIMLESSEPSVCGTTNQYDNGGVGDFSVMLDPLRTYLYVLYSAYGPSLSGQGVSVARMRWADRDDPAGAVAIWQSGLWLPASSVSTPEGELWSYPTGTPIYPARRSWHSADGVVDAFWGPSVHWNTYLRRYVMLLNHANSVAFNQEGIYVAFATSLENPGGWSPPQFVTAGGLWYPQVVGLDPGSGTDKQAGQEARFYLYGHSNATIRFERATQSPPCLLPCVASDR